MWNKIEKVFFCIIIAITTSFGQQNDFSKILTNKEYALGFLKESSMAEKEVMIEYLFTYEGNKAINTTWYEFTNDEEQKEFNAMKSSVKYIPKYLTNQMIALYLISSIIESNYGFCKVIELKDEEGNVFANLKGRYCNKSKFTKKQVGNFKYKVVNNSSIKVFYKQYRQYFAKEGLGNESGQALKNIGFIWGSV